MCRNSLFCLKNLCRAESFAACPAVVPSRGFRLDANFSFPRSWNLIHGRSSNGCSVACLPSSPLGKLHGRDRFGRGTARRFFRFRGGRSAFGNVRREERVTLFGTHRDAQLCDIVLHDIIAKQPRARYRRRNERCANGETSHNLKKKTLM